MLVAAESALKEAGAITGNTDMTLFNLVERLLKLSKSLAHCQEKQNGFTPLHVAFASGNIEVALWIMAAVQNTYGTDALTELVNIADNVSSNLDLSSCRTA